MHAPRRRESYEVLGRGPELLGPGRRRSAGIRHRGGSAHSPRSSPPSPSPARSCVRSARRSSVVGDRPSPANRAIRIVRM